MTSGIVEGVDVSEDSSLDGAPVYPSEGRLLGFVEVSVDVVPESWADGCDEELNDGDDDDFNGDEDINDGGNDDCSDGCNDGCSVANTVFAEGIMFVLKSRATKPLLT